MKRTVREFMLQRKLGVPETIGAEASLREVAHTLRDSGENAILVSTRGRICGIISDHDLLRHFAASDGEELALLRAKDIMTKNVYVVTPQYTLEQCLMLMARLKIRHLPVVDEDSENFLCLLSLSQIAAVLVEDKEFMINELIKYISGPSLTSYDFRVESESLRLQALS